MYGLVNYDKGNTPVTIRPQEPRIELCQPPQEPFPLSHSNHSPFLNSEVASILTFVEITFLHLYACIRQVCILRHCVSISNFLFILTFYLQCFVHCEIISDLQNCYRNRTITKYQLPRFQKC